MMLRRVPMGGANEKLLDRRTDVVLLTYQNTVARFTSIRFSSTPDDLIKAVNSIPAYIEHATPAEHHESGIFLQCLDVVQTRFVDDVGITGVKLLV